MSQSPTATRSAPDSADAWKSPTLLSIAFVVALALTAAGAILDVVNDRLLESTNGQVARKLEAMEKVRQTTNFVYVAESAQRSYLLTGAPSYLATYQDVRGQLPQRMAESAALITDNATQHARLDRVRAVATRRFADMDRTLEVYATKGREAALAAASADEGPTFITDARAALTPLLEEERRLAAESRDNVRHTYRRGQIINLASSAVIALALIAFFVLMRRNMRERDLAFVELERSNAALERRVRERTIELSDLSRHLLNVREDERKSLARDLHDEFGSYLTAINMDVSRVRDKIAASEPDQSARLERTLGLLNHSIDMKRRLISDLRPSILDNLGLGAALEQYIDDWSRTTGISTTFRHEGDLETGEDGGPIAIFRVFQEALTNIAKHANANEVSALVRREGDEIAFEIADDGVGLSADARTRPGTHGLLGIRERVLAFRGRLEFGPGPRGGTRIKASVLCPPPRRDVGGAGEPSTIDALSTAV